MLTKLMWMVMMEPDKNCEVVQFKKKMELGGVISIDQSCPWRLGSFLFICKIGCWNSCLRGMSCFLFTYGDIQYAIC